MTTPVAKASRLWEPVLLSASNTGFQVLLRAIVVPDQGRWIHPWDRPALSHTTNKECHRHGQHFR